MPGGYIGAIPCENTSAAYTSDTKHLLSIYPNPASNQTTVSTPFSGNFDLEIFNTQGKLVLKLQNQNKLEISNLTAGLYVVRVIAGNSTYSGKLLKH